jgi:cytochrome c553
MWHAMKYNSNTKSVLIVSTLLCLLGFSSVSLAVQLTGSCPADHQHMGHGGMGAGAEADVEGSEIKAGEKFAEAQCSNCHGRYGVSKADDVPNLAGQESMYLCAWLDECRKKGRQCEGHEDIAAKLSDHDIIGLSEFYAHLPAYKW